MFECMMRNVHMSCQEVDNEINDTKNLQPLEKNDPVNSQTLLLAAFSTCDFSLLVLVFEIGLLVLEDYIQQFVIRMFHKLHF